MRDAISEFDPFIVDSTPETRRWMRSHYWRMRGYPPFFDRALDWAPPSGFYSDLYAIYRNERFDGAPDARLVLRRPDWVLRDAAGNALYIPFDCSGGSCPQYAADIGNPEWRALWIERARRLIDRGYAGVFIDDVNFEMKVSDGAGRAVEPVDPRTGRTMTLQDWRRYVAEFTEEIERALPEEAMVTQNLIWYAAPGDPSQQRAIEAADDVQLERGFSDAGIVAGDGKYGYESLLSFIDAIHSRGRGVIYKPYSLDPKTRIYEIAGYFLAADGDDAIAAELEADPNDWWRGWETELGAPEGARFHEGRLLRRNFERGLVVVNQPGLPPAVFKPGGSYVSIAGRRGPYLLDGGEGEVLLKAK